METIKIIPESSAKGTPAMIEIPAQNPLLQFMRKQRIFIFVGLILVTVLIVVTNNRPNGSDLKTQLNTTVAIPTEDNGSIPVNTAVDTNTNSVPVLVTTTTTTDGTIGVDADTVANDVTVPDTVSTDTTLQHDQFLENLDGAGTSTETLKPAAPIGGNTTKSGPETLAAIFFSFLVAGAWAFFRMRALKS